MSEPTGHAAIPPIGWHGARIITGTDAAKGLPEIIGQLYLTTDLTPRVLYVAKADLSGWDILAYMGLTGTPNYIGFQTQRSPGLAVANNTNTNINHTTDTVRYDHGSVKSGTAFAIPAGKGGVWQVSATLTFSSAAGAGDLYCDIQNSVGAAAGAVEWDGYILDPTKDTGVTLSGELELPAGATFGLRVFQLTGGVATLGFYRLAAHLIGVP